MLIAKSVILVMLYYNVAGELPISIEDSDYNRPGKSFKTLGNHPPFYEDQTVTVEEEPIEREKVRRGKSVTSDVENDSVLKIVTPNDPVDAKVTSLRKRVRQRTSNEEKQLENVNKHDTQNSVAVNTDDATKKQPRTFPKRPAEFNPVPKKPARAKDPVVKILAEKNVVYSDRGTFHYSFEGEDGTKVSSQGELRSFPDKTAGESVSGSVSYKDEEGNDFSLSYTADENGYRPVGAHLPTPPPIPPEIARALEHLATKSTIEPATEAYYYEK